MLVSGLSLLRHGPASGIDARGLEPPAWKGGGGTGAVITRVSYVLDGRGP